MAYGTEKQSPNGKLDTSSNKIIERKDGHNKKKIIIFIKMNVNWIK